MEKLEGQVKKTVEDFKRELGKLDVDVDDFAFTISKYGNGVSINMLVKINITKK